MISWSLMPPEKDEIITSVEDLDDKNTETPETSETEEKDTKEEDGKDQPQGQEDDLVEIEGVKYSKDDLAKVFDIGKKVSEYQKEHPGYDPILIHKDYTKKTQELAHLKRQTEAVRPAPDSSQKEEQKKTDLSKFRKEDIEYFEQLASGLGYAKVEEIEKREKKSRISQYESVKREEISKFLETHPEYKPANDSDNLRWDAITAEFEIYKVPEDPRNFGKLLEHAHRIVAGTSSSVDSKKLSDIIAKKKAAASGQSSIGGGGGGDDKKISGIKDARTARLAKLAKEGGLSGYSKEELEEMFS